jgi:histidinol-phosphate aminotransferase
MVEPTISSPLVRADVSQIQAVTHGSVSAAELAEFCLTPSEVLDFSVNTNPLGPAACVQAAVQAADWTRYPGDDEQPLREALAEHTGVEQVQVALGNGSVELVWLVGLATLRPGDRVVVVGPTFGEYARAATIMGAEVVVVPDLSSVTRARLLFLCNPNNPTGLYFDRGSIEHLLREDPMRCVVLDEAYAAFIDDPWTSEPLLEYQNLVILRSMTKEHSLPGLRLGYLLGSPALAQAVEAVRPPWSVNAGALRAGLAALEPEAEEHVAHAHDFVRESRRMLSEGFSRLGFAVHSSAANFVLVDVDDAANFRRTLLPHALVVRDCSSFGLPNCVRIACRLPDDCARLLATVEQLGRLPAPGQSTTTIGATP